MRTPQSLISKVSEYHLFKVPSLAPCHTLEHSHVVQELLNTGCLKYPVLILLEKFIALIYDLLQVPLGDKLFQETFQVRILSRLLIFCLTKDTQTLTVPTLLDGVHKPEQDEEGTRADQGFVQKL